MHTTIPSSSFYKDTAETEDPSKDTGVLRQGMNLDRKNELDNVQLCETHIERCKVQEYEPDREDDDDHLTARMTTNEQGKIEQPNQWMVDG